MKFLALQADEMNGLHLKDVQMLFLRKDAIISWCYSYNNRLMNPHLSLNFVINTQPQLNYDITRYCSKREATKILDDISQKLEGDCQ